MRLPKHLKNFNVSFGVSDFSAICEEVTLPKLKHKTEEYRGAGMDAPIEIEVGREKLEATFKFAEQTIEGFISSGVSFTGLVTATVHGHMSAPDGSSDSITAILRGWVKTVDSGTWKAGEPKSANQTIEMAVLSYMLTRGAIPLIAIDIMNGTSLVGPIDQLSAARKNLKIN